MRFSLLRFIRGRDAFGHPISVFFKGDDTHQSLIGGLATVVLQLFTLVMMLNAVEEMYMMEEPNVNLYVRPLSLAERGERGALSLEDYKFIIAFDTHLQSDHLGKNKKQHVPLTPDIGTIEAYVIESGTEISKGKENFKELKIIECDGLLSQETIGNSIMGFQRGIKSGSVRCLDPKNAYLTKYRDDLGGGRDQIIFSYTPCSVKSVNSATECLEGQKLLIDWYQSLTKIDYSSTEDYVIRQMDQIYAGQEGNKDKLTTHLRPSEVTFMDSIYDPFGSPSDELTYLTRQATLSSPFQRYLHSFELDNMIHIEQRVRYNFWQALGDVGGFYDGLGLIISTILSPIAATRFLVDLFVDSREEVPQTPQQRRHRRSLADALNSYPQEAQAPNQVQQEVLMRDRLNFAILTDAVRYLRRFRFSTKLTTLNCLCRCVKKRKGHSSIDKLENFHKTHLDIRRIIKNSISLQDFFRCYLSRRQKVLLAHQRSQVAAAAHSDDQQSEWERNDPLGKFDVDTFRQVMVGFEPVEPFEKRLTQGVLYRHCKVPNTRLPSMSIDEGNYESSSNIPMQNIDESVQQTIISEIGHTPQQQEMVQLSRFRNPPHLSRQSQQASRSPYKSSKVLPI